jgi:hypothetical protein
MRDFVKRLLDLSYAFGDLNIVIIRKSFPLHLSLEQMICRINLCVSSVFTCSPASCSSQ